MTPQMPPHHGNERRSFNVQHSNFSPNSQGSYENRLVGGSSQQQPQFQNSFTGGSYPGQYPSGSGRGYQHQSNPNALTTGLGILGSSVYGGAAQPRAWGNQYGNSLSPQNFGRGYPSTGGQGYIPTAGYSRPSISSPLAQAGSSLDEETIDENVTHNLIRPLDDAIAEKLCPSLYPTFQVVQNHRTYFIEGRVFKMLWIEPLGSNAPASNANVHVDKYGGTFHAKVQRFIVMKPKPNRGYSNCVQISTNGSRGAGKNVLDPEEHTIAYTTDHPPSPLPGEGKMYKKPIKIIPINQTEKLDESSRINLAKVYPVEHNVKICNVGMVDKNDIKTLRLYYKKELKKDLS